MSTSISSNRASSDGDVDGLNDLASDAWGRQKVVNDYSLFHGIWTYNVPGCIWVEEFDETERTITSATSVNKELKLVSGAGASVIRTKRAPRYQPNRGLLYSSSVFVDGITNTNDGTLYAVRRTTVGGVTTDNKVEIEIDRFFPEGIDLSKGNIFDIQSQWRGVGNVEFFINLKAVTLMNILGTLDNLSVSNPALHIAFECTDTGIVRWGLFSEEDGLFFEWNFDSEQETTLRVGCVDLTSEGGRPEGKNYGSYNSGIGDSFYTTNNSDIGTVALALHIPETISYGGGTTHVCRDAEIKRISAICRSDEITVGLYYIRNTTAFDALSWVTPADSLIQTIQGGTDNLGAFNDAALQTAFEAQVGNMELVTVRRADTDVEMIAEFMMSDSPYYMSAGDFLFLVIVPDAGTDVTFYNLELAEEI